MKKEMAHIFDRGYKNWRREDFISEIKKLGNEVDILKTEVVHLLSVIGLINEKLN
jgi:hypothetical protein